MNDYKKIISEILEIIKYSEDREKHSEELTKALNDAIQIGVLKEIQRYFEEYFRTIEPTLNSEQKDKLTQYLQNLKKEQLSSPASEGGKSTIEEL